MKKNYANIAAASLVIAGGLFAVTLPYRSSLLGGIVHAASEAALVGGMADWYAVTALFRHPLNLSWIPHTAIIPQNREKIIAGIVDMVQNKWLNKEIIEEKLYRLDLAGLLWSYAAQNESKKALTRLAVSFLGSSLEYFRAETGIAKINNLLLELLRKQKLSDIGRSFCIWFRTNGYGDKIFSFLYEEIKKYLISEKFIQTLTSLIESVVNNYIEKGRGGMMMQMIAPLLKNLDFTETARTIQTSLVSVVEEDEESYRLKFQNWLLSLEKRLAEDPVFCLRIEAKKALWLADLDLSPVIKKLMDLIADNSAVQSENLEKLIFNLLDKEIAIRQNDQLGNEKLNSWLKKQLAALINSKHEMIGQLVQENLDKLSEDDFVVQIEEKVGQDLQWIRVNGAVVGGLVGVILYLLKLFIIA